MAEGFAPASLFGIHVNLGFHAIRRHLQREVKGLNAVFEFEGPADQRLDVNLSRAHQGQGARVNVRVPENGFDGGFLGA